MHPSRWLVALIGLVPLTGCGHRAPSSQGDADLTEVNVAKPERRTIRYVVEQPGRIEPIEQTPIYARITGYVRSVRAEIGQRVKRGELLAELDVPDLVEAGRRKLALIAEARAAITQAEKAEKVAEANLTSAQAEIDIAKAAQGKAVAGLDRWKSEYERMERLVREKVVDQQSRDEVRNQFRSAEAAKAEAVARIRGTEAAYKEAGTRHDKASADRQFAESHLAVVEADERETQALLSFARITAPYDGVITDRRVHTGHFLQGTTGGPKGDPLFVTVRTDKVRVFVEVPEADAVRVRDGDSGSIRVQVLDDRTFTGKIAGTSWALDPSQRTLRTEIDFANPDGILRPGMYVHASIDVERRAAWLIPSSAVLVRDGVSFCFQVVEGKTRRRPLRLGLRDGSFIEVLKFQSPPRTPGDRPQWTDPTGQEQVIVSRPGELMDNQAVRTAEKSDKKS